MKNSLKFLFCAVFALVTAVASSQTVRYVKATATGLGNGSGWSNAADTLQGIINASSSGDTVFVAVGTYIGGFYMKEGVHVYGGFKDDGSETTATSRKYPVDDSNLSECSVLDGGSDRRVVSQPANFAAETVWDGFVIQNGRAMSGGGVYLQAKGVLRNCVVTQNQAGTPGIGEYIASQGGVVFHVDATGKAYVMAMKDASTGARFDNGSANTISTVGLTKITDCGEVNGTLGSGPANTAAMVAQGGLAAKAVNDYTNTGFTNPGSWYLPSVAEWQLFVTKCLNYGGKTPLYTDINTALDAYGGTELLSTSYWSSTVYSASGAWYVSFGGGSVGSGHVSGSLRVRVVRAFYPFNLFNTLSEAAGGGVYVGAGGAVQGCLVTGNTAPNASGVYLAGADAQLLNATVADNKQMLSPTIAPPKYKVGDVYPLGATGSAVEGIVFWVDPTGEHGWMVDLNDGNSGSTCQWLPSGNHAVNGITETDDRNTAIADTAGYKNTLALRTYLETNYSGSKTDYAAYKVDFANGWYLPAAGQLRTLYAVLPEVNTALTANGTAIGNFWYWSSTQYGPSDAWDVNFANGFVNFNYVNSILFRVRFVRAF